METLIGSDSEEILLANLKEIPSFLRFNEVLLIYDAGSQSLITKCCLFEDCLNLIKPALKDSNEIFLKATIKQDDPNHFSDHSSVVVYLRDRLLPICDSSRRYVFSIWFTSDENSASEVISSILQISQVRSCSHVSIELFGIRDVFARLPVEEISNWLAQNTDDVVEIYGMRKWKENRFLKIIYSDVISNTQEMWEHLKQVNLAHCYWLLVSLLNCKCS